MKLIEPANKNQACSIQIHHTWFS